MTKRPCGDANPDELRWLNQSFPGRYPFLLQSTAQGSALGQFDILFAAPDESLVLNPGRLLSGPNAGHQTQFLDALDEWWQREKALESDSELPFTGGWFLYLGYELASEIEPRIHADEDLLLPMAFAVRCRAAVIFDHQTQKTHYVCETECEAFREQVLHDLAQIERKDIAVSYADCEVREDPPEQFIAAVLSAKQHIDAGDVYQTNLSRQWSVTVPSHVTAERIYASLCDTNPGPFAGIARWQDTTIISSSPERLVKIRDGEISTRPIAGTRPRGRDAKADSALSDELFTHPKERAEHIMLIDLERNDLGRVCKAGTVEVDEMMVLESYAHVHHIVSNVRGELRDTVTPGEAIAAVFPGGTITGCPKVRCMEIIAELELAPRGAYTGSFGYLNRDGSMDLNILIRTIVKHGNDLTFRAGAGIVADSEPQAELAETRAKAEGMLKALHRG